MTTVRRRGDETANAAQSLTPSCVPYVAGATALLLAVQHKRPLSLLALLDMGADIDATDNQGCGVAHYAASVGCVEVLRILKHRKYPLNKLDNRGMLPLHRAARSDQGDVVDFLVDNHNDPLLRAEGKTPREMVSAW